SQRSWPLSRCRILDPVSVRLHGPPARAARRSSPACSLGDLTASISQKQGPNDRGGRPARVSSPASCAPPVIACYREWYAVPIRRSSAWTQAHRLAQAFIGIVFGIVGECARRLDEKHLFGDGPELSP